MLSPPITKATQILQQHGGHKQEFPAALPPSIMVDLGFEGLDGGGGIGLLGGEDAVDERFDFLRLLINQLRTCLSSQTSRFANSRLASPAALRLLVISNLYCEGLIGI